MSRKNNLLQLGEFCTTHRCKTCPIRTLANEHHHGCPECFRVPEVAEKASEIIQHEKTRNNVKLTPIDDRFGEMMNWAIRYALGRHTYAASDTVGYMFSLIPYVDSKTLWVAENDIERNLSLVCEKEAEQWKNLLNAIRAEIDIRTKGDIQNEQKRS